jgi:HD-like signal output (HDOD) protein
MFKITGKPVSSYAVISDKTIRSCQCKGFAKAAMVPGGQSFPTMPEAGAKMLGVLEEPDTEISDIEEILRYDPGLTANILKLANSAYFGIPSKIGSLKQAVMVLGFKRLKQLVVASCVSAVMDKSVAGYDLPPGNLWRHSIAVSLAAEALVRPSLKMCLHRRCSTMSANWF